MTLCHGTLVRRSGDVVIGSAAWVSIGPRERAEVVEGHPLVSQHMPHSAPDERPSVERLLDDVVVKDVGRAKVTAKQLEWPSDPVVEHLVLVKERAARDVGVVTV